VTSVMSPHCPSWRACMQSKLGDEWHIRLCGSETPLRKLTVRVRRRRPWPFVQISRGREKFGTSMLAATALSKRGGEVHRNGKPRLWRGLGREGCDSHRLAVYRGTAASKNVHRVQQAGPPARSALTNCGQYANRSTERTSKEGGWQRESRIRRTASLPASETASRTNWCDWSSRAVCARRSSLRGASQAGLGEIIDGVAGTLLYVPQASAGD